MQLHAPAADRNKEPILAVLKPLLPATGVVLEVASGTGQHLVHFARQTPQLRWQPSDPDAASRSSIAAYTQVSGLQNIAEPLALDAAEETWPDIAAAAVLNINMMHIAPWSAAVGLLRHTARILPAGGLLFLYGPFVREGVPTAQGNLAFDALLRVQNPAWGLRSLDEVIALAKTCTLSFEVLTAMPANNLSVIFRRQ